VFDNHLQSHSTNNLTKKDGNPRQKTNSKFTPIKKIPKQEIVLRSQARSDMLSKVSA